MNPLTTEDITEHVAKMQTATFEIFIFLDGSVLIVGLEAEDFSSLQSAAKAARECGDYKTADWIAEQARTL